MRYASCYRMCAIYISKSNFIRRALCIHWNRIWNVYIWLDSFFHLMLSGIVKKTQQKRKKLKRKKKHYGGYMSNIGNAIDIQIK